MGILDIFRRRALPMSEPRLTGKWVLVRADAGIDLGDGVQMDFTPGGNLTYVIKQGDTLQIMKMTYRVEGNQIISNQPSAPKEERTAFGFEDDMLVLNLDGCRSWFRKSEEK